MNNLHIILIYFILKFYIILYRIKNYYYHYYQKNIYIYFFIYIFIYIKFKILNNKKNLNLIL